MQGGDEGRRPALTANAANPRRAAAVDRPPNQSQPIPPRESAVLLALYERDDAVQVLFIKRTDRVGLHKGEIGFPGGRIEPDDRDALAAALREAEEEVGIPSEAVMPLGALPLVETIVTNMIIFPFVGRLDAPPLLIPSEFEVAKTIEVPLPTLLDPATYHEEDWIIRGVKRRIFVYRYGPYDIWGATGRIVQEFLARLEAWPERPPVFAWTLDEVAAALAATAPPASTAL